MNTNQLKRFAQQARTRLLQQVRTKMDFVLSQDTSQLRGRTETLQKLNDEIRRHGKEAVIDKVAYTWFNRLVALRFMDVNGYQPIGMSVVSPATPSHVSPQILTEAHSGNIPEELKVNKEQLFDILDGRQPSNNPDNDVYRMLLVAVCNNLSNLFPFLFERIEDYTELLLPDDLTSPFSIVTDIVNGMAEEDCREVEIIGWLYQFYISEKKDEVFTSKSAVKKEDIPAATQLFTPRWIVEYMVQNTVGKLWLQNRPNSRIRQYMPYYIESASDKATDYLKLESIEDLKLLDQACGSGHILVYGFELLYKIYEEEGYSPDEIPQLIIEKNLYGFEIDERAAQLAGFALMMKARSYHRHFFRKEVKPNIICFTDLSLRADEVKAIFDKFNISLPKSLEEDFDLCRQATNFGSLIQPQTSLETLETIQSKLTGALGSSDLFSRPKIQELQETISQLIPLSKKYHCVVDNPPYLGSRKMNKDLSIWLKCNGYSDVSRDLYSSFIKRGMYQIEEHGFLGMITQISWMFTTDFIKFREVFIPNYTLESAIILGSGTFDTIKGEVVKSTSFIINKKLSDVETVFVDVTGYNDKVLGFKNGRRYFRKLKTYLSLESKYFAYKLDKEAVHKISKSKYISEFLSVKQGLATGNNDKFIRCFWEIETNRFKSDLTKYSMPYKWIPYDKGGGYKKYYGNDLYVIDWINDGEKIKNFNGSVIRNQSFYFKEGFTFNLTGKISFRYKNKGHIFDVQGSSLFLNKTDKNDLLFYLALLNSKISVFFTELTNPTMVTQVGDVSQIPLISNGLNEYKISDIGDICLNISKQDWDSRETSWDFQQNELIRCKSNYGQNCADIDMLNDEDRNEISGTAKMPTDSNLLEDCYEAYKSKWTEMFFQLHRNEEELNRQFIEIYGLQDELTPDVPLEEITILQEETFIENGELVFHADEVFAQFVSYAVGCMFGRYSLDKPGLILANQGETLQDYLEKVGRREEELTFVPDRDNIIPVLDDEWFRDDIVERFYTFLKASFGEQNFRKNLDFVEECLGMDIRKYFTREFYKDHIRRYKKRPIYWMFSSPKGYFNVLVYLHRYTPDTINRILNSYLKEYIEKLKMYRTQQEHIEVEGSVSEQNKARKEIDRINIMLEDCIQYERDILYPLATERIALDLDDGVLVNYNKLGSAVAKVDGLNDKKTKQKVREFDWIDVSQIRD